MRNFQDVSIRELAKKNIDDLHRDNGFTLYPTSDGCTFVLYEFAILHEIDLLNGEK